MNRRKRVLSLAIAALGWAALACTCSAPNLSGPSPAATVPVSAEAAKRMQNKLDQAATQAKATGQFKVTLTESEVTSYLVMQAQALQKQGEIIPVTNPQIKFTQGQAWIYGTFESDSSKINGLVVVSPQVQNNKLTVKVVRADFGPIPVPGPFLDQFNQELQASVDEQSKQAPNLVVTGITIREGEIDVAGKLK